MLMRLAAALLVMVFCLLPSTRGVAWSDGADCFRRSDETGSCLIGGPGGAPRASKEERGSGQASHGAQKERERTCSYLGKVLQCSTALGGWSEQVSAWCRALPIQPGRENTVWEGRTTGSIYACTRPGFDGLPNPGETVLRWLPGPPEAAAAPDPEDLARRLLASIDFQAPEIGMFPRGDSTARMSYVGWHMWLWAAPSSALQWGPVTDSITEAGVSVTLTARVTGLTWNMGDGGRVSCAKGTAWSEAATGGRNVASPDCGYVYRREGRHTVTVTSDWAVEWAGGGRSGSLPFSLSRSAGVLVGEMQSVHRDA